MITRIVLGLCLVALTASVSFGQTISTVAGTGINGYSGDGGPATAARLYAPTGVAVDGSGNIFIADWGNNCIRKVSSSTGIISTVAGQCGSAGAYGGDGGPATAANLNTPYNVCLDATGNLYFTETLNYVVRKVDTSGIITTIVGNNTPCNGYSQCGDNGPAILAQLAKPQGIAVDSAGNIYIGDLGNFCIRKVNTAGVISTIAGDPFHYQPGHSGDGLPVQSSRIAGSEGLAFDASGNLYDLEGGNYTLRKITAISHQIIPTASIIDRIAGVYGPPGFSGDGGPATSAKLNDLLGVIVDSAGNIYISDHNNRRIRKINTSGIITTIAGTGFQGYTGDGGLATAAKIQDPSQLATDACGNLYFADWVGVIRKITNGVAPALNPSITSASPVCAGNNITATGHYSGTTPPDSYSWQLQSCTPAGIPTSAYNSGVLTYTGAPTGAFSFPNTSNLPCNQNYLITFTVKKNCPTPSTATVTKQIFINCKPTLVITGNTTICYGQSTTLCANYPNNAQYTVEWVYHVGTVTNDIDAQCITVSPTTNTTYSVSVTDNATRCKGNVSVTVVVARNNPDFTYQVNYSGSGNNYFTISATPVAPYSNGVAGFGDLWVIEPLDALGNPLSGTNTGTSPNPTCWWIYPAANIFNGFDGTKSSGINNVTCSTPSPGRFLNGGTYKIWHGIWNNFCPWAQTSHTITVIGHRVIEKATNQSGKKTPDYSYLKPSSKKQ